MIVSSIKWNMSGSGTLQISRKLINASNKSVMPVG